MCRLVIGSMERSMQYKAKAVGYPHLEGTECSASRDICARAVQF